MAQEKFKRNHLYFPTDRLHRLLMRNVRRRTLKSVTSVSSCARASG